mmetsp:Transcript_76874/g.220784  ORF Transcript_76874/g.220784 Transcript_76874/m.220784 type:complete len:191 (+) Transcript_76874:70-642(+)
MSSKSGGLFKNYNPEEFVSSQSQCKSSVARAIRARILQDYPEMEEVLEHILPKKQQLTVAKGQNHVQLLLDASGEVMFFQHRDSGWYPSLRLAHRYPELMPTWQVDEGAIPHVLDGSNIFCAGFVNEQAAMDVDLEPGQPVVVMAHGKDHACCVGLVKKSRDEIRAEPKGVGVEMMHYLNDGLWISPRVD